MRHKNKQTPKHAEIRKNEEKTMYGNSCQTALTNGTNFLKLDWKKKFWIPHSEAKREWETIYEDENRQRMPKHL